MNYFSFPIISPGFRAYKCITSASCADYHQVIDSTKTAPNLFHLSYVLIIWIHVANSNPLSEHMATVLVKDRYKKYLTTSEAWFSKVKIAPYAISFRIWDKGENVEVTYKHMIYGTANNMEWEVLPEFLVLRQSSKDRPYFLAWIKTCEKRFYTSMSKSFYYYDKFKLS